MELQCPKCDYVAMGADEAEAQEKLREHAQSAHGMDESGFNKMLSDMKHKISELFGRGIEGVQRFATYHGPLG